MARVVSESFNIPTNKQLISQSDPTGQFLIAFMGQFLIAFMGQFLVAFVGQGVIDYMNDDRMKANLLPLMNQMRIEQKKADRYPWASRHDSINSYTSLLGKKKYFLGELSSYTFIFFLS